MFFFFVCRNPCSFCKILEKLATQFFMGEGGYWRYILHAVLTLKTVVANYTNPQQQVLGSTLPYFSLPMIVTIIILLVKLFIPIRQNKIDGQSHLIPVNKEMNN